MKVHIPKGESTGLYSTTVQQVRVCRFIPDGESTRTIQYYSTAGTSMKVHIPKGESTGLYSTTVQQVRV